MDQTSKIDKFLLSKAVESLIDNFHAQSLSKRRAADRIPLIEQGADAVHLQICLNKPIINPVQRPIRVTIPHSIFSPDDLEHGICLFCRSEDKAAIQAHLAVNPIKGLNLILSMNDAVKLYKPYKERRMLRSTYTHFLCDSRIMKQLYNCLGKTFNGNHMPMPIDYTDVSKLASSLQRCVDNTHMRLTGKVITIITAHTSMNIQHIKDNVLEAIINAVDKIPEKWSRVNGIHIKTTLSPALPVYGKDDNDAIKVVKQTILGIESKDKQSSAFVKDSDNKLKTGKMSDAVKAKDKKEPTIDGSYKPASNEKSDTLNSNKNQDRNKVIKKRSRTDDEMNSSELVSKSNLQNPKEVKKATAKSKKLRTK